MSVASNSQNETQRLALRFLQVFQTMNKLTENPPLDSVMAQLNVNQLRALQIIYYKPGITQKELAEDLEITPASVSINVRKMVADELIAKQADEKDGRLIRLYLGQRGQHIAREAERQQTRAIVDLMNRLPYEEQQLLVETVERALRLYQNGA